VHTHSDAHLSPYKTSSSPGRELNLVRCAPLVEKPTFILKIKYFLQTGARPSFFSIQVCHQMGVFKTINLIFEKRHHLSLPSFCLV